MEAVLSACNKLLNAFPSMDFVWTVWRMFASEAIKGDGSVFGGNWDHKLSPKP